MPQSIRKCEVMQYIKFLPGYPDNWQPELEENLTNEPNIKSWVYIIHDKDIAEDGTLIDAHVHIILELNEPVKFSTVGGYVGVPAQYVSKIKQIKKVGKRWVSDVGGAISYLTHRNAKDKHQYSDDEIIAQQGYDWMAIRTKSEAEQQALKSFNALLIGIELGEIRKCDLTKKIPMSTYIDNKKDIESAFEFRSMIVKNNPNRKVDVIYITGESGTGKTTLAKKYCEDRNLTYCVSGSSRDPVQDYSGQKVLILDDLRPDTFRTDDLLKLLDNNTGSSANSRYHDKWLEVDTIIITTVLSLRKFFLLMGAGSEPEEQLKRRCSIYIELKHTNMRIFFYNKSIKDYVFVGEGENPVAGMFTETEDEEEKAREICKDFGVEYTPNKYKNKGDAINENDN